ncbi:hypothetical protein MMC13_000752 [Lambiella insularis]|nr:hypothetical protein [Lambiella insularis]
MEYEVFDPLEEPPLTQPETYFYVPTPYNSALPPPDPIDKELDPYRFLKVDKTATEAEIRTAYKKLALIYHPDKNRERDRAGAHRNFQRLALAYAVLSSPRRRALYDTTGSVSDSIDTVSDEPDFDWHKFFRAQYAELVTPEGIEKFGESYRGSEKEKEDVLAAYTRFNGKMKKLYQVVILSNPVADEERFRDIINAAIESGTVEALDGYTLETKEQRTQRLIRAREEERAFRMYHKNVEEENSLALLYDNGERFDQYDLTDLRRFPKTRTKEEELKRKAEKYELAEHIGWEEVGKQLVETKEQHEIRKRKMEMMKEQAQWKRKEAEREYAEEIEYYKTLGSMLGEPNQYGGRNYEGGIKTDATGRRIGLVPEHKLSGAYQLKQFEESWKKHESFVDDLYYKYVPRPKRKRGGRKAMPNEPDEAAFEAMATRGRKAAEAKEEVQPSAPRGRAANKSKRAQAQVIDEDEDEDEPIDLMAFEKEDEREPEAETETDAPPKPKPKKTLAKRKARNAAPPKATSGRASRSKKAAPPDEEGDGTGAVPDVEEPHADPEPEFEGFEEEAADMAPSKRKKTLEKRKAVAAAAVPPSDHEAEPDDEEDKMPPPKRKKPLRKAAAAAAVPNPRHEPEVDDDDDAPPPKRKKTLRKRKPAAAMPPRGARTRATRAAKDAADEEDAEGVVAELEEAPKEVVKPKAKPSRKPKKGVARRKRTRAAR